MELSIDREKVINGLEFTKAMITFNPSTGEDIEPGNLNEADKTTYDACVGAIALLKEQEAITGHWIDTTKVFGFPRVQCSVCGSEQGAVWMYYCPICGAKMQEDGEVNDT